MPPPKPGLRYREEEYRTLKDAADSGSTQARLRLDAAKRALERQRMVAHRIGKRRDY